MPAISECKCSNCNFSLPTGSGGYVYAESREGIRVPCMHPREVSEIYKVLGQDASRQKVREKTGYNSFCVCLDCLYQFDADLRDEKGNTYRNVWAKTGFKDSRLCPECGSGQVKTLHEMIGQTCPACRKGVIKEIWTDSLY